MSETITTGVKYLEALGIPLWVRREKLADFSPAPATPMDEAPAAVETLVSASVKTPAPERAPAPTPTPTPTSTPAPAMTPPTPVERKARNVRLGPGEGPGLFLCAGPGEAAGPLAGDLGRALGGQPAWAWPDDGDVSQGLADASGERMFTALVVFGAGLARMMFGGKPPVSCGAARVVVAPSMAELKSSADARRECWRVLRESGVIPAP